jgi:Mg-chelatase subunit ChlI
VEDISRPASVRASIANFEHSQAVAALKGRNHVEDEDIKKAAVISLQGRTEVSPGSRFYDDPPSLFKRIIKKVFERS